MEKYWEMLIIYILNKNWILVNEVDIKWVFFCLLFVVDVCVKYFEWLVELLDFVVLLML